MTGKDLLVLATTSGGVGLILSGVALFMSNLQIYCRIDWMFEE